MADYLRNGLSPEELERIADRVPLANGTGDVTIVANVTDDTVVTGSSRSLKRVTAQELQDKQFPEPQWIIPGLLPIGLAILAGRPKAGKSWLALNIAIAVANGGRVFGSYDSVQSYVLYMALEDNERRLQNRQGMIFAAESINAPSGLSFLLEFPRFDEGGYETLEQEIADNPRIKLIVIDTLQRLRRRKRGSQHDTYAGDYEELGRLQKIALASGVAIIVVHHTTKMNYTDPFDSISGTSGISGTADTLFVLARSPEANCMALHTKGRDTEDQSIAMKFEPTTGIWSGLGDIAAMQMSGQRKEVLEFLEQHGPAEVKDIEGGTSLKGAALRQLLKRMVEKGQVERPERGRYQLPVASVTTVTSGTSVELV
ncbi:MAG: AAA family ATPase [Bacteroidetes bacterium]|nr:AAA family ATPase [Bacteroidota bacterium]